MPRHMYAVESNMKIFAREKHEIDIPFLLPLMVLEFV